MVVVLFVYFDIFINKGEREQKYMNHEGTRVGYKRQPIGIDWSTMRQVFLVGPEKQDRRSILSSSCDKSHVTCYVGFLREPISWPLFAQ